MQEPPSSKSPRIAVLIPCYNEASTIEAVVRDFRKSLPQAVVYVYDNNSTDSTADRARSAGAVVRLEPLQGKGHVVRRMFSDVEADVYALVDGDATYDAPSACRMVDRLWGERLDMVTGIRIENAASAYRPGHRWGNMLLTRTVALIFGDRCSDMLSGYRVFSRRFVKSFPSLASGFEIETEFTVHALELCMPIGEVETPYYARPPGSASKLNTFRDGWRILRWITILYKNERPLLFFGLVALVLAVASLVVGIPIVVAFLATGLVPRLPSAVLAAGIANLSCLSLVTGVVLDTVTRGRREAKRIAYLALAAPGAR